MNLQNTECRNDEVEAKRWEDKDHHHDGIYYYYILDIIPSCTNSTYYIFVLLIILFYNGYPAVLFSILNFIKEKTKRRTLVANRKKTSKRKIVEVLNTGQNRGCALSLSLSLSLSHL